MDENCTWKEDPETEEDDFDREQEVNLSSNPEEPFEEPEEGDDIEQEIRVDENGEELPTLGVWVNSGFGNRSYACVIQANGMMTLPDGLVRELGINIGDDLDWTLDEDEGVIYVKVIRRPWEAPTWMDTEEEQDI